MCHWDGFQAASTTQKDSGVIEMVLLNGGKRGTIGPLPIIFLPFSVIELEKKHGDLFGQFLTSLLNDLEKLFIDGLSVRFNYPSLRIADCLEESNEESCLLGGMLMQWTGDHPVQCKLGLFKDGGKSGCRRDQTLTQRVSKGATIPYYVYGENIY